jgi:hypothetical protein
MICAKVCRGEQISAQIMTEPPDDRESVGQEDFTRLTGVDRHTWSKWVRRRLVEKVTRARFGEILSWPAIRDALHPATGSTLDLVYDPQLAAAIVSRDDATTGQLARTARQGWVLSLADETAWATTEFRRTVELLKRHADPKSRDP